MKQILTMRISFDADVLIYASKAGFALGEKVAALLADPARDGERYGSVLLLPELLIKPTRLQQAQEQQNLVFCLSRLTLIDITEAVAELAVGLGARYGLKAADALHLASAVHIGAEAFLTNNHKDFASDIAELQVLHPEAL